MPIESMALRVKRVGQYGPHATAKKNGFREGDIIVRFDGCDDLTSEVALLQYSVQKCSVGDQVDVSVDSRRQAARTEITDAALDWTAALFNECIGIPTTR